MTLDERRGSQKWSRTNHWARSACAMTWAPYVNGRILFLGGLRNASSAPRALSLRPYQESCLQACIDALNAGASRIGVSLPTGAGKTTVFVSLLPRLLPPHQNSEATRSLIVVNSIELARQAALQAKRLFPHWVVEIEQGAKHKASGRADVCVFFFLLLLRMWYSGILLARSRRTRLCSNQTVSRSSILAV